MKRLQIKRFGPINDCEIDIKEFNVIIGRQSSGKSTIAKCLYYFFLLKDEAYKIVLDSRHPGILADGKGDSLSARFQYRMKTLFDDIFGYDSSMLKTGTFIRLTYTEQLYIQIRYTQNLSVAFSYSLQYFLDSFSNQEFNYFDDEDRKRIKSRIDEFFQMDYSAIYIPAGRSILTTLGNQFSLFYSMLNDSNKRLIDLCTRNYYETVMQLKPLLNNGFKSVQDHTINKKILSETSQFINTVINGEYHYSNGMEYLVLPDGTKVDINYASSGQQEALWIYNLLIYYALKSEKKFIILEEPESNLFPESQMSITQFIGFIANKGFPVLMNTHSPYVLGELNNMIYAGTFKGKKRKAAAEIVAADCQVKFENVQAMFIDKDNIVDCMDYEIKQIDNSKLDQISMVINEEYNKLFELEKEKR